MVVSGWTVCAGLILMAKVEDVLKFSIWEVCWVESAGCWWGFEV